MPFKVKAECIDARSGKRFHPGDLFPDPEKEQAERLVKAGCLEEISAADAKKVAKATAAATAAEDAAAADRAQRLFALDKMSPDELAAEAARLNVDISKAPTREAAVALILGG